MLPETSASEGLAAAEPLQKEIESTPVQFNGISILVTVSVGLVDNTHVKIEFNELLACAIQNIDVAPGHWSMGWVDFTRRIPAEANL